VKIGDHNQIREYVTINRGTAVGGGVTRVGDHNFIMAYVHIAHDCLIGNHVIMANSVGLAGHVEIRDHAIIGGMVGIGQYCRIGTFAYLGGFSKVRRDILPFMITAGSGVEVYVKGVNSIGLSRKGVSKETIRALKEAYKQIFIGSLTVQEGITIVKSKKSQVPEVVALIKFIENTKQGISGNRKEQNVQEDQSSSHRGGVPRELSH
jgi:UDP-N-acetylglucosamine acyltransferase